MRLRKKLFHCSIKAFLITKVGKEWFWLSVQNFLSKINPGFTASEKIILFSKDEVIHGN